MSFEFPVNIFVKWQQMIFEIVARYLRNYHSQPVREVCLRNLKRKNC